MVKVYRELLVNRPSQHGVLLDTPFGFQENVPQLTTKIVDYFKISLQFDVEPATLTNVGNATALEREQFLNAIRRADFVFAGPGSPSYALKQWAPLPFTEALSSVLARDGLVCFSSAAALTLGRFTAPIYELYKVGDAPHWIEGLDLLGEFGLRCVVIPHFDNAEGGNHDTRFCYLGERRLLALESLLSGDVATLGVDEHTAIIFDWASDTARVRGRGNAYWRSGGSVRTLDREHPTPLEELRNSTVTVRHEVGVSNDDVVVTASLGEVALGGGDEAVRAVAELVRRAANGGEGRIEPAPLVEGVLRARSAARTSGQYALADELRDALVNAGIEVQDSPEGASWSLRTP